MSHCVVPQWNRRHQRQAHQGAEEEEEEEGTTTSPHVHTQNLNLVPMSTKYEVAELTWENGQVAMHGLGQILPTSPTKSSWPSRMNNDTLESIVHQATIIPHNPNLGQPDWVGGHVEMSCPPNNIITKKRMRESSVSEPAALSRSVNGCSSIQDDCASASATFCWANHTSRSLKTITTAFDDDSGASENRDDHDTKSSISARRSRAAAVHNQSERRRRDRINQKMKTLQKLVPNASKTDKASILDEVIEYLKQLQAQIRLMNTRNINMPPQMMMPLGMQHQLHQMALLARMAAGMPGSALGMGMGMGMMDMANLSRNAVPPPHLIGNTIPVVTPAPPFVPPPPFVVPPAIPKTVGDATVAGTSVTASTTCATNSVPFSDPYSAFLAQSMNMEFYNKMAALYTQQANHQTKSSKLQSSLIHGQDH